MKKLSLLYIALKLYSMLIKICHESHAKKLPHSRVVKWTSAQKSLSLEWWREHDINNKMMS